MRARRLPVLLGSLLATLAATAAVLAAPVATAAPPPVDPVTAALDASPPGSNDWTCRPSAERPEPVVLVHGLSANQANNWSYMAPILKRDGFCVFSLTYGRNPLAPPPLSQVGGLTEMERSAEELRGFVDRVRRATGAEKVDLFGHSEGSLMPNHYVKFLDGAQHVKRYVGLTPLWDGTKLLGADDLDRVGRGFGLDAGYGPALAALCASCRQFLNGSDFLDRMNAPDGPRVDGVDYTMIMTEHDEVVVPFTSGEMDGADNVVLQDVCPDDRAGHAAVAFDPNVAQIVLRALEDDRDRPVRCAAAGATTARNR